MGHKTIRLRPTSMIRKQAGQMRKLLDLWRGDHRRKSLDPVIDQNPQVRDGKPNFLSQDRGLHQTFVTRRQLVLNRHFTEIISDVLALNFRKELLDNGVSITSIETKAWNKGVDVYYCTPEPFNLSIHRNLYSLVSKLRMSISERRLIGRVPPINFVYDETIEMERRLTTALEKVDLVEPSECKDLVQTSHQAVIRPKVHDHSYSTLKPWRFTAPEDMSNNILGLDYPLLYNKVVAGLERGRGESSRMLPKMALASTEPLFTGPLREEVVEDEDPAVRILKMRKYLVSQKKKYKAQARSKRQQELLLRDRYKWDDEEEDAEYSGHDVS